MVEREFSPIPTPWVRTIGEIHGGELFNLPMWGTMWLVNDYVGTKLSRHAVTMSADCGDDYDEEMEGERWIKGTAAYLYRIENQWVVGVNGAGWNFYEGVWDVIYDLLGLEWHKQ